LLDEPVDQWLSRAAEEEGSPEARRWGQNGAVQAYPRGELVVVLDCHDLERSASFWCEVLGYRRPWDPTGPYLSLYPGTEGGPELLLQRVPELKQGKNRMHLDLRVPDLVAEVERVLAAGAVLVTEQPVEEEGWRWHILADPDGNELCVLQEGAA
jgi:catechol 2,3-dioxygenase-like lactoylglutathione lyase family enzyme